MLHRLRLITGLILFFYVTLHLANHVAGLWSLDALESSRRVLHWPWFNPLGLTLLYLAFTVHILLALYALYRRRRLRMPFAEAAQLLLGLAIPPLLLGHVLATRAAFEFYDANPTYPSVLLNLWHFSPAAGAQQAAVLLAAWVHGCIGVGYWLRLKPRFRRARPVLFAAALLLPTLALCGYWQAGKEADRLAADPSWVTAALAAARVPDAAQQAALDGVRRAGVGGFFALIAAALALRALRLRRERRYGTVRLRYDNGVSIQFPSGRSILEASREAGVPHVSVCGGRGRCSTCRVTVVDGGDRLAPPSDDERRVLLRINAGPQVRLACQTRPPAGTLSVMRGLPAGASAAAALRAGREQGRELNVTVLFADIRAFTTLAETKLPYDVVFLLNQYFSSMGHAIESAGGRVDKFIGDGIMALFGTGGDGGARPALDAAYRMSRGLETLNRLLANDLNAPLRIGIGVHSGPAIVGEMGYAAVRSVTAIGDTVNIASRLEAISKEFAAELVASQTTIDQAGLDLDAFEQQQVAVRGRREPLCVRVVPSAGALPFRAAPR